MNGFDLDVFVNGRHQILFQQKQGHEAVAALKIMREAIEDRTAILIDL